MSKDTLWIRHDTEIGDLDAHLSEISVVNSSQWTLTVTKWHVRIIRSESVRRNKSRLNSSDSSMLYNMAYWRVPSKLTFLQEHSIVLKIAFESSRMWKRGASSGSLLPNQPLLAMEKLSAQEFSAPLSNWRLSDWVSYTVGAAAIASTAFLGLRFSSTNIRRPKSIRNWWESEVWNHCHELRKSYQKANPCFQFANRHSRE
jgi:hypothetical protein